MSLENIKRLLEIGAETNGYSEQEIQQGEKIIGVKLPDKLRTIYLTIGKNRKINFNYYLTPPTEFKIFNKKYLVFYQDNNHEHKWMINLEEIADASKNIYINRISNGKELVIEDIGINNFISKIGFLNIGATYLHTTIQKNSDWLRSVSRQLSASSFRGPLAHLSMGNIQGKYYWNHKGIVIKLCKENGRITHAEVWGKELDEFKSFIGNANRYQKPINRMQDRKTPLSVLVEHIEIKRWRQYEMVNIDFHPRLTIITGRNGSGKSTILNMISKFYGWEIDYLALPQKNESKKILEYLNGVWDPIADLDPKTVQQIGQIQFNNNQTSNLVIPTTLNSTVLKVTPTPFKAIKGLHIHSHRPLFNYQRINQIPASVQSRGDIYKTYQSTIIQSMRNRMSNRPTVYHLLKSNLIALSIFGEGNSSIVPNEEAKETFFNFQEILRIVLPKKLGFKRIKIQMPEIILETASGDFTMDSVSGGIASIIHMAWQIFLYASDQESFVVTFDEPENHLHPALQKTLLPNLMQAFPDVQFIIVSHNKHIISSVKDCSIYVLDYNENSKVISKRLNGLDDNRSSEDILNDALGMN